MAPLKAKGDWAEIEVARDLVSRGFRIAIPYGQDWDFDLIFQRPGGDALERVQVKYAESRGEVLPVRCRSHSLSNGRVRRIKHYTAATIDWIAVFDRSTSRCYYVPASELGSGRSVLHLRLTPTQNGQRSGVRFARDYVHPTPAARGSVDLEPAERQPATSSVLA